MYDLHTANANFGLLHEKNTHKLRAPISQRNHQLEEVPVEFYPVLNIRIKHAKGVCTWEPPKISTILIFSSYIQL